MSRFRFILSVLFCLITVPSIAIRSLSADLVLRDQVDPFSGNNRYADVWGEGDYAYVGSFNGSGVSIFDVSNPFNASLVAEYQPTSGGQFKDVKASNSIGYFASDNGGGLHIVNLSDPTNPTLISQIKSGDGGYDRIHNVFVNNSFAFQADSRTSVVKVFDISDPSNPAFVRDIATSDNRFIHDVTSIGDRLYTSGFGGKTDIFDISQMSESTAPVLLGTIDSGSNSHSSWGTDDGNILVSAREIGDGDIRIYNIADPANPELLATIDRDTIGIQAHSPHNPVIVGDKLYVSWYQAGVQVFDISDPSNPVRAEFYDTFPGSVSGFDGNWGVYPFLGEDRILLSDMDGGLFVLASVPEPSTIGFLALFSISLVVIGFRRASRAASEVSDRQTRR